MALRELIKKIHDDNRLKLPTDDKKHEKEIEQFILNSKVKEMFDFLHYRMDKIGKPQEIGMMWENVMFTVTCEPVTDFEKQRNAFLQRDVE